MANYYDATCPHPNTPMMLSAIKSTRIVHSPAATIVALTVLLVSCNNSRTGKYSTGGTSYLGPNGTIITDDGRQLARPVAPATVESPWQWNDSAVTGAPSIVISISNQSAQFYKGDTMVGWAPVSTGNSNYPTPTGNFTVKEKDIDHVSNLYGSYVNAADEVVFANASIRTDKRPAGTRFKGASMPYFMRVIGGVGMHAGYLPGYPDSHGCIRLPDGAAERFFTNTPLGTPVKITP